MVQVPEENGRDLNVQSGREGPAALGQGDAKLPAGAMSSLVNTLRDAIRPCAR